MATFGSGSSAPTPTEYIGPSDIADTVLNNPSYTNPQVNPNCGVPTPDTACDEKHELGTRYNETILPGVLAFAGAGKLLLLPALGNVQIFEIDFQFDAGVTAQLFEGGGSGSPGNPVSGAWNFSAGQFFTWGGKYTNQPIFLNVSAAVNVTFEIRYRAYGS